MARVAQLIPYFGRWPEWLDLYLYSCGKNPMVDFHFFTDCDLPNKTYNNTIFHIMSFDEYCGLVSEGLGIEYHIDNYYKLTDLKPFLGLVHKDIIRDYDFWGFSDIDLVYGDLSMVVNEKNLRKYDLLTTHNYHIAGHFTICRNNDYYNTLCQKIDKWKERLCDNTHYGFDEAEWSALVYPNLVWVRRLYAYIFKRLGVSFTKFYDYANSVIARRMLFKEFHTSPAPQPTRTWSVEVKDKPLKVMSPDNISLPYLHFLFFKKTPWLDTERYWTDGYYRISGPIDQYRRIFIDDQSINGVK